MVCTRPPASRPILLTASPSHLLGAADALQAERDSYKGQRDLHEGLSKALAHKLREAAYSITQLQASGLGESRCVAHGKGLGGVMSV